MSIGYEEPIEGTTIYEFASEREVLTYEHLIKAVELQEILSELSNEGKSAYSVSMAPIPVRGLFSLTFVIKKIENNHSFLKSLSDKHGGKLRDDLSLFRITGLGVRGRDGAIQKIFRELKKEEVNIEMYFAGEVEFEFYINNKDYDLSKNLVIGAIGLLDGIRMTNDPTAD